MKAEKPTFPLNAWYAAAYDVELGRTLLARTVCKQKIVMFRKLDGTVAALEDACWHRLMPLSLGHLDGDEVTWLGVQRARPLHPHAQPRNAEPLRLRAQLSRRRKTPFCLDVARRPR
jgi:Rieske [2Fe-2S] domain